MRVYICSCLPVDKTIPAEHVGVVHGALIIIHITYDCIGIFGKGSSSLALVRERLCLYFCCQGTTRPLRVSSSISYTFPLGYHQAVHLVTTQDVFNFNQSIKVLKLFLIKKLDSKLVMINGEFSMISSVMLTVPIY